ncbi:hypothetical protein LZ554_007106 [Drepanopeziza brunnea f. sp. 'monogermtubi']|nr:hypothetical protein LZ554_007106 [Drepanopeziza brunnea f. sp. 'monogermtubi']
MGTSTIAIKKLMFPKAGEAFEITSNIPRFAKRLRISRIQAMDEADINPLYNEDGDQPVVRKVNQLVVRKVNARKLDVPGFGRADTISRFFHKIPSGNVEDPSVETRREVRIKRYEIGSAPGQASKAHTRMMKPKPHRPMERKLRPFALCQVKISLLATSETVAPLLSKLREEHNISDAAGIPPKDAAGMDAFMRIHIVHQLTLPSPRFYNSILQTLATYQTPFDIQFQRPFAMPNGAGKYRVSSNVISTNLVGLEQQVTRGILGKLATHRREQDASIVQAEKLVDRRKRAEFRPAVTAFKNLSAEEAKKISENLNLRFASGMWGKEMAVGVEVTYRWQALQAMTRRRKEPGLDAMQKGKEERVEEDIFLFASQAASTDSEEKPETYWDEILQKYKQSGTLPSSDPEPELRNRASEFL